MQTQQQLNYERIASTIRFIKEKQAGATETGRSGGTRPHESVPLPTDISGILPQISVSQTCHLFHSQ